MSESRTNIATPSAPEAPLSARKPKIHLSALGRKLLIRGENKRKFEEIRAQILKEIDPITEIEKILCEKFIAAVWKLQRAAEVERNLLSAQNTPVYTEDEEMAIEIASDHGRLKHGLPDRRVRHIKKIDFDRPEVQSVIKQQQELEKSMVNLLGRIREEQKLSSRNSTLRGDRISH